MKRQDRIVRYVSTRLCNESKKTYSCMCALCMIKICSYPLSLTNVLSYTCDQASYSQDCEVRLSLK